LVVLDAIDEFASRYRPSSYLSVTHGVEYSKEEDLRFAISRTLEAKASIVNEAAEYLGQVSSTWVPVDDYEANR
jgi:hypothetical protein